MSKKLLEIGVQKKLKQISLSWQEIAEQYSEGKFTNGEVLRCWVKSELKKSGQLQSKTIPPIEGLSPEDNYKKTIEINKDGSQTSDKLIKMSEEDSKDVNYLLIVHGYDPKVWELISARSNIWNSYSKLDGKMTLYSSKISVKPRTDNFSIEDLKDFYKEMSETYTSPVHVPTRYSEDGKMLEISIADLHLGKLAWSGDSNDTYNYEIARKNFFYIINDVLTRTNSYKLEKILFVWSHDFFHVDNTTGSTTAGTRQDTDIKWAQMYKIGTKMLVEAIDLLSQVAPVVTFYVGANHDKQTSFYATEHLAAWFRNTPNVTVDTDPKIRQYVEFGECLIQFSHGHAEGKRIGDVMSIEAKEAWGRTSFKEVHAGHFHSEKTVTKDNGVIVRYLGSPSATDTWHYESGYVGAIKKGQSFLWDKKKGLLDAIYTTIE